MRAASLPKERTVAMAKLISRRMPALVALEEAYEFTCYPAFVPNVGCQRPGNCWRVHQPAGRHVGGARRQVLPCCGGREFRPATGRFLPWTGYRAFRSSTRTSRSSSACLDRDVDLWRATTWPRHRCHSRLSACSRLRPRRLQLLVRRRENKRDPRARRSAQGRTWVRRCRRDGRAASRTSSSRRTSRRGSNPRARTAASTSRASRPSC